MWVYSCKRRVYGDIRIWSLWDNRGTLLAFYSTVPCPYGIKSTTYTLLILNGETLEYDLYKGMPWDRAFVMDMSKGLIANGDFDDAMPQIDCESEMLKHSKVRRLLPALLAVNHRKDCTYVLDTLREKCSR